MNRRGFTLVELMIVSVLIGLAAAGILVMTTSGQAAWLTTDAQLETMTAAQRALDRMSEDLRAASVASVNATPPNQCAANALSFLQGTTRITYGFVAGTGTLTRTVTPVGILPTTQTVGSGLTGFTAACAGGIATLNFTAQSRGSNGRLVNQTVTSQVWVKNP